MQSVFLILIRWIVIYPKDSAIQCLNNRDQEYNPFRPGPARSRQRESSSRANADCKTFYWVLTFLLTDGFTFWKAAEKCLIPTPTGLWIEGWSSSLITWLVDRTLIHSRKAAMLASRTNAARSAPLNKARKHEWLLKLYKVETKENCKVEQRSKIRRLDTTHDQIGLKKSREN